jgi:hypothetical protein
VERSETLEQFTTKLHKVNNHPMGENSPNLVTLHEAEVTLTCNDENSLIEVGCTQA